jgi:hypothetical protein
MDVTKEPESGQRSDRPMTTAEAVGWLEFGCWTMVALAPFLYWVNGPAVSADQFVVRTALVTLALTGGMAIRGTKWLHRSKRRCDQPADDNASQKNG